MSTLFSAFTTTRKAIYQTLGLMDRAILRTRNQVVILSYHSVSSDSWRFSVSESMLKKQIKYLKEHYDIITIKTLHAYLTGKKNLSRPSVVLTFDDGYRDIIKLKSFFAKEGITPALFVLSQSNKPNWKELGNKRPFLTTAEIKSLHKAGWEIGCHSATHANLATLSMQQAAEEIVEAKKTLEKKLGFVVPYFAYPRGKYNETTLRLVKKAKYLLGFTMDDGLITPGQDTLTLPRVGIDKTHSFAEFTTTFSPSVVRVRKLIKQSPAGKYL